MATAESSHDFEGEFSALAALYQDDHTPSPENILRKMEEEIHRLREWRAGMSDSNTPTTLGPNDSRPT